MAHYDLQFCAVRALEAGKYPNNISELEAAVERAVAQSLQSQIGSSEDDSETKSLEIGEEVFWFASGKVRNRKDVSYICYRTRKYCTEMDREHGFLYMLHAEN